MSTHDESKDLESRLRLIKPQTEPLPPAFKRQLRQALMEQMTMNNNIFSFRTLGMALGGLILLLGIPLLFWLSQTSIGTTNPPGPPSVTSDLVTPDLSQEPDSASLDMRQMISMSEINGAIDFTMPTEDNVWLVSTSVPRGQTVSHYDTLDMTLGYDLISAEEAKLVVQLLGGGGSVLTVEKTVYGISGLVEFALPLSELEAITGERVDMVLRIRLQDINSGATSLNLFGLSMNGWTVDLTAEPPTTKAEIVITSPPYQPDHYLESEERKNQYRVDLTVRYRLEDYDLAFLFFGYEYDDGNGIESRSLKTPIEVGRNGEFDYSLSLDQSLINESGEVEEWVNFFARINYYDEKTGQWINIYPGNATLSDREQTETHEPFERFAIDYVAWGRDEMGRPLLKVNMDYTVFGKSTADINLKVTTLDRTAEFATGSATVNPGKGRIFLVLPFYQPFMADEPLLNLSAELTVGDRKFHHAKHVLIEGADLLPPEGDDDDVWIIATDANTYAQTGTEGVDEIKDISIIVGYNLSSEYSSGHIIFYTFDSLLSGPIGTGKDVTPGSGIVRFSLNSTMTVQELRDRKTVTFQLFGTTGDGTEVLVAETSQWDWKNEPIR